MVLIMLTLNFFSLKRITVKLEGKIASAFNVFGYENGLVYPVHVSDEKCISTCWLTTNANNSHYVYIKDFNRFCEIRQNIGIKNAFEDIVCNVLVVEKYW